MGLSQNGLARAIGMPPRRINEIVHARRAVTADTDLRLARYFGFSEGFFRRLQDSYYLVERKQVPGATLDRIAPSAAQGLTAAASISAVANPARCPGREQ